MAFKSPCQPKTFHDSKTACIPTPGHATLAAWGAPAEKAGSGELNPLFRAWPPQQRGGRMSGAGGGGGGRCGTARGQAGSAAPLPGHREPPGPAAPAPTARPAGARPGAWPPSPGRPRDAKGTPLCCSSHPCERGVRLAGVCPRGGAAPPPSRVPGAGVLCPCPQARSDLSANPIALGSS